MPLSFDGAGIITGLQVGGLPDGTVDQDTLAIDSVGTAKIVDDAVTVGKTSFTGDLQFNSGFGSAATAYGVRAWVQFRGDISSGGNSQINGSGNVSSVTDNGTGDYTVNFTNAMPDTNYIAFGNVMEDTGGFKGDHNLYMYRRTPVTGSVRVNAVNLAGNVVDDDYVYVGVIR